MTRARNGVSLVVLSLCAASALAEDGVPQLDNHYDLKKAMKTAKGEDEKPVNAALAKAMVQKITDCYREEQGAAMSDDDHKLLVEFSDDVVRDLAPALAATPCEVDQAPTQGCLNLLEAQDCKTLAEPIIAQGWDRNLTDAARANVARFAKMLGARESACEGRDAVEAEIVQSVRSDRLAALIEAQIVMGKCEMFPDKLAACEQRLRSTECEEVLRVAGEGQAPTLCTDVLPCQDVPIPTEEDAKK